MAFGMVANRLVCLYTVDMNKAFAQSVTKAVSCIRKHTDCVPQVGLILGSGMSHVAQALGGTEISFSKIKGFPNTSVVGHQAALVISQECAIMAGRFHYYEGHQLETVVKPVAVLASLGVKTLVITNAAGGIRADLQPGDLALIEDHINLQGNNPFIGPHDPQWGPRFPDMSEVYSSRLRKLCVKLDPKLKSGIYAALSGPSYETPAEIRMLKTMGADLVGMSTVPEALFAKSLGLEVIGISLVTNAAAGLSDKTLNHDEVIQVGKTAEARLIVLIASLIRALNSRAL